MGKTVLDLVIGKTNLLSLSPFLAFKQIKNRHSPLAQAPKCFFLQFDTFEGNRQNFLRPCAKLKATGESLEMGSYNNLLTNY